ncbi:hypothetical protein M900_1847 [Bacteriovorax sp. Seq25_V]|nr:hypothetical protein M900_1847 [Bacteriovorax sp. Seq25_V]
MTIFGIDFHIKASPDIMRLLTFDFKNFNKVENELCKKAIFIEQTNNPTKYSFTRLVWKSERYNIFESKNHRLISYANGDEILVDFSTDKFEVYSVDHVFLHEMIYLIILSRLGKILDLIGVHKIHGMSCVYEDNLYSFIGASNVGKSTLLLNLLSNYNIKVFSDDLLFLNSNLVCYIFPLRVGIPKDYDITSMAFDGLSQVLRRRFGLKELADPSNYLPEKQTMALKELFLLKKGHGCSVRKSTFLEKFSYLMKYLCIGFDTPIIFEIFWQTGISDFFRKLKIFLLRMKLMIYIFSKVDFKTIEYENEEQLKETATRLMNLNSN